MRSSTTHLRSVSSPSMRAAIDTTALDAAKGEVVGKIDLGGKPEFAASDEKGTMFVNIEDSSELVAFDPQKLVVKSRWRWRVCEEPTGLALDKKNRRLFAGCGGNKRWRS